MPETPAVVLSILPPKRFDPAPSCTKSLPTVRLAPMAVVNRPALVTSIVVPTVLFPTKLILRSCPMKSKAPDRVTRPLNVVDTVPALCV